MARKRRLSRLYPYVQAVPDVFRYQTASALILAGILWLLNLLAKELLHSTGRVAVSSGDFKFIFFSWQGLALLMLGLLILCLYVAFDLNMKIVMGGRLLRGENASVRASVKDCARHIRVFFCLEGLGVVLYIALIAPVIGIGFSIALTRNLYIPTFITSVIHETPLYQGLYDIFFLVFALIGLMNVFCLPGILLDDLTVRESIVASIRIMRKHWKNYLKETVLFSLRYSLILILPTVLLFILPLFVAGMLGADEQGLQYAFTLSCAFGAVAVSAYTFFATPYYMMKTVQLYETYRSGEEVYYQKRRSRHSPLMALVVLTGLAAVFVVSWIVNSSLDILFPAKVTVPVIAHRGGGNEGAENTIAGMETAAGLGAYGSEIDIQRTLDGYYVLNHDATFERTAGVDRKVETMTLAEVRELRIDGEPVPTLEEMLEASRDKVVLFVELKGNTADERMADDAAAIIKEMHMEDQAVLISLKYDLIDYIETKYPELQTGYLTFISFGDTASLNCDYLGLEEEAAARSVIEAVHDQNKKVLVWTANEEGSQRHFLRSDIDGLITDEVSQAQRVISELEQRTSLERIIDLFLVD
ncbi:MAG: glycerophosphoryl diester phosphodiesterase membrane domain-containing protein [Solobacterium sp.]|nr:glycerophosphoryl diester phosphodiesterase membrane domain-containing protein [Solobacterium sp.]